MLRNYYDREGLSDPITLVSFAGVYVTTWRASYQYPCQIGTLALP